MTYQFNPLTGNFDLSGGEAGPRGPQGPATVSVDSNTVTGNAGSNAAVENTGTSEDVKLKFTIPRGDKGDKGDKGDDGATGPAGSVQSAPDGDKDNPGFKFASGGGIYKETLDGSSSIRPSGHFASPLTVQYIGNKSHEVQKSDANKILTGSGDSFEIVVSDTSLGIGESVCVFNISKTDKAIIKRDNSEVDLVIAGDPTSVDRIEVAPHGFATVVHTLGTVAVLGAGLS